MRQDIILKPWQIELTTNSTNDSFEESTFFTGNGRMGIRGYLPFWQEKRTFETGLFVAGIFGEIKPGITDFVNLLPPSGEISNVMDILLRFPLLYPAP